MAFARDVVNPPMIEPEVVAVSRAGDLYLTDCGNTPFTGSVYKIAAGNISRIVDTIRAGSPAGIALSLNEGRRLVSTLQPAG